VSFLFFLATMLLIVGGGVVVLWRLDASPPAVAVPSGATQPQVEQWLVAALYHAAALATEPSLRLTVQILAAELGGRIPLVTEDRFVRQARSVEACVCGFPRGGPGRISIDRAVGLALHLEHLVKGNHAC